MVTWLRETKEEKNLKKTLHAKMVALEVPAERLKRKVNLLREKNLRKCSKLQKCLRLRSSISERGYNPRKSSTTVLCLTCKRTQQTLVTLLSFHCRRRE